MQHTVGFGLIVSDDVTFALQLPSATAGRLCLHQILNPLILDLESCHVNRVHLPSLWALLYLEEQALHHCLTQTWGTYTVNLTEQGILVLLSNQILKL